MPALAHASGQRAIPWPVALRRERVGEDIHAAFDRHPRARAVGRMGEDELAPAVRRLDRRAHDLDRHDDDGLAGRPRAGEELDHVGSGVDHRRHRGIGHLRASQLGQPGGEHVVRTAVFWREAAARGQDRGAPGSRRPRCGAAGPSCWAGTSRCPPRPRRRTTSSIARSPAARRSAGAECGVVPHRLGEVDVAVPEPGGDRGPRAVEHARAGRHADVVPGADRRDEATLDEHDAVGEHGSIGRRLYATSDQGDPPGADAVVGLVVILPRAQAATSTAIITASAPARYIMRRRPAAAARPRRGSPRPAAARPVWSAASPTRGSRTRRAESRVDRDLVLHAEGLVLHPGHHRADGQRVAVARRRRKAGARFQDGHADDPVLGNVWGQGKPSEAKSASQP